MSCVQLMLSGGAVARVCCTQGAGQGAGSVPEVQAMCRMCTQGAVRASCVQLMLSGGAVARVICTQGASHGA